MLNTYVEPDGSFASSLNQVLARIYNMGIYRDLTVQYSLPVQDGCITLPDDAHSVLHTMVDGQPAPVRSIWQDFKSIGIGSISGNQLILGGLIDAGFSPILRLFGTPTDNLYVGSDTAYPYFSEGAGESISIIGTDGTKTYASFNTSGQLSFTVPITDIISIQYSGLRRPYTIAKDGGVSILATVGPDSGVTRYRRFRVTGGVDGTTVVHVLCKRAFQMLNNEDDISYVSNIGAIKQGLLGRLMEDNGDIERAQYHWNQCMLLMEEEVNSSRGAAIPRLNIDPYGTGMMNRLYQQY